jgi:hypothetical protein
MARTEQTEPDTSLNDSQQQVQQHGPLLKESPLLMYWQSAAEAVQATTAVVVVQAAEFRSKQALLSLEQSIFRLVQVVPLVQAIQTTARTDQRQRLAQFPLAVETVAVQTAAQAVPQ